MTQPKDYKHVPVLADEVSRILVKNPEGVYVDGTFGRGGHSRLILNQLTSGKLFAFDRDVEAIQSANNDPFFNGKAGAFRIFHSPFAQMREQLAGIGVDKVDGILLDIGISSPQIDDPGRGFSFRFDGPLDMRMDVSSGVSAAEWLASADPKDIAKVIREYGEERFAPQIARAIEKQRGVSPIETTRQLASLVAGAVPRNKKDAAQHPATRTFQAIRIFINDELGQLRSALDEAGRLLAPGGMLAVITFHSLEDRIVKKFFEACANPQRGIDPRLPLRVDQLPQPLFERAVRVLPGEEELERNPRARSSILRYAVRTGAPWGKESLK